MKSFISGNTFSCFVVFKERSVVSFSLSCCRQARSTDCEARRKKRRNVVRRILVAGSLTLGIYECNYDGPNLLKGIACTVCSQQVIV